MLLKTENSIIELNLLKKEIRYIRGKDIDPNWKQYKDISYPMIGKSLFIVWDFVYENGSVRAKSSSTEPIIKITQDV